jgi:hypothetical protein
MIVRSASIRLRLLIVCGAVAVMALAGLGAVTLEGSQRTRAVAADDVAYRDPNGRFTLTYPAGWSPLPVAATGAALVLRAGSGSQDSALVRTLDLDHRADTAHLNRLQTITDSLVQTQGSRILIRRQIDLNGVPGFYYLYTFGTAKGGVGLHAHYFLFPGGNRMDVLVMQALPESDFRAVAPVFDRIADSYRVLMGGGGDTSPPPPIK